jgi:tripartite-type tricarboxylate transporter receptor subunit TctC
VPFPAGGPTDVIARTLAEHMRMSLGQAVIVENVSGANGNIGVGRVARADGYTINIGHWSTRRKPSAPFTKPRSKSGGR